MNGFGNRFDKKRLYLPVILGGALVLTLFFYGNLSLTASSLRQQASSLTSQASNLTNQLSNAESQIQNLLTSQTKTKTDFDNLQQQYSSLYDNYTQINSKYSSLSPLHSSKITAGPPIFYDTNLVKAGQSDCSSDMEPAISCSDLTLQYSPVQDDVSVGDVIAFYPGIPNATANQFSCTQNQSVLVLHRVIQIIGSQQGGQELMYGTKGDANTYPDTCFIPFSWIVGKVYAIVKQSTQ